MTTYTRLPKAGKYTVYVSNLVSTDQYVGPYQISIKSSGNAWSSFAATSSVE